MLRGLAQCWERRDLYLQVVDMRSLRWTVAETTRPRHEHRQLQHLAADPLKEEGLLVPEFEKKFW